MPGVISQYAARVMDPDHRHDVASIELNGPRGSFCLQFADTVAQDGYVWNLCNSPPELPDDLEYDVLEDKTDSGAGYALIHSSAEDPQDVVTELDELRRAIGGEHTEITKTKTYRSFQGAPTLRGLLGSLKDRLSRGVA